MSGFEVHDVMLDDQQLSFLEEYDAAAGFSSEKVPPIGVESLVEDHDTARIEDIRNVTDDFEPEEFLSIKEIAKSVSIKVSPFQRALAQAIEVMQEPDTCGEIILIARNEEGNLTFSSLHPHDEDFDVLNLDEDLEMIVVDACNPLLGWSSKTVFYPMVKQHHVINE
jgi:hypothetical protein